MFCRGEAERLTGVTKTVREVKGPKRKARSVRNPAWKQDMAHVSKSQAPGDRDCGGVEAGQVPEARQLPEKERSAQPVRRWSLNSRA